MSRSRKKHPVIKDNANTGEYWRPIRREWKQMLKKHWDNPDLHLRNRREIQHDWDFWDWTWYDYVDEEHKKHPERSHHDYYGTTYDYLDVVKRK